jgi:hypothetical protein
VALDVERVSVAGSWWRQAAHGADPLLLPSPPSSGRWQRGASVAAIYVADEEETAWAEWYRVLAEIALPPTHGMPRDLWCWTIAVSEIADLSTPAKLAKLELPPPAAAEPPQLGAVPGGGGAAAPRGLSRRPLPERRMARSPGALPLPRGHRRPRRRAAATAHHLSRSAASADGTAHLSGGKGVEG